MIGHPLRRVEDHHLITGRGRYVDDIAADGMLHAVFVRSVEAHASIRSIEMGTSYQGGARLLTAADLGLERPMPSQHPSPVITQQFTAPPLAVDEVCHVGQPIAVVVAGSVAEAMDAAEHVAVDYEPLPFVVDHRVALEPGASAVHEGSENNLIATLHAGFGEIDEVFGSAPHSVAIQVDQHRGAAASLEGRAVAARWDEVDQQLTMWTSTQTPHVVRDLVAPYIGLSADQMRVVAPDVGGGFGPKAGVYPEEYVVAALAIELGRPVKWNELRREHFVSTMQARGQSGKVEAAFDDDGRILGLRADLIHDCGAYVPYGVVAVMTALRLMSGPYSIPAVDVTVRCAYTNATPTGAIRGAGRPNAVFAVERAVDAIARDLGIDQAEIRRRNLIPPEALPYQVGIPASDGTPVTYDSGDYPEALEAALEAADVSGFEARRAESAHRGKLRGYGIACYVEDTGVGPYDGARLEILPDGEVVVEVGSGAQGQGHQTVLSQIVGAHLGVSPGSVRVHGGDTARYGHGVATVASRTGQTVTSVVHLAAEELARQVKEMAAERLEAATEDIVLENGQAMVIGQPGSEIPLGELAGSSGSTRTGQGTPGLSVEEVYRYGGSAFAYGTHVAEVEIDPESGHIATVGYTVVHDCGNLINPMIVDGQIDGGVAHGLGNALMERVHYEDSGQPVTTSFMDYRIMTAVDMPPLVKMHRETPSPTNPLGAKGAGEGGTIPAAAALAAAVEHALSGHGVSVNHYPITSEWVSRVVRDAT